VEGAFALGFRKTILVALKARIKSAASCAMESACEAECNQGASLVWNHHKVMHDINPKEKYTLSRDAIRLTVMPYTSLRAVIAYQSFGLDKKDRLKTVFFGSVITAERYAYLPKFPLPP
jgi:hypothetical protein